MPLRAPVSVALAFVLAAISVSGFAEVYQPSAAEVDELIGQSSPDQRVPDSVVAKVRDRLLSGKRCFIGLTLTEVRAADLPDRRA